MTTVHRTSRVIGAVLAVALGALLVGVTAPAYASTQTVGTDSDLTSALGDIAMTEVTLSGPISHVGVLSVASSDVVLDLNGFALDTEGIALAAGTTMTIENTGGGSGGVLTSIATDTSGDAGIATSGATLVVDAGQVVATGDPAGSGVAGGAGIGGQSGTGTGTIQINGGAVTATGGYFSAGIGGSDSGTGGSVEIDGGIVNATGGPWGQGIGSGRNGSGTAITITDGTVTALGDAYGAGLGNAGSPIPIDISGGTVVATGGPEAAGIGGNSSIDGEADGGEINLTGGTITATTGQTAAIGGGLNGNGGDVTIGTGATVTVNGTGVGAGGGTGTGFGTLSVAGTLNVSASLSIPAGATASVTSTGVITGTGAITGAGTIDNLGSIRNQAVLDRAATTDGSGLTITGNDHLLTFETNIPGFQTSTGAVRVYASSLDDGDRVPTVFSRAGWSIAGWNTERDGSGTDVEPSTALTGDLLLYAQWSIGHLVIVPSATTVTAGGAASFTVLSVDGAGHTLADLSWSAQLSSSSPQDFVFGLTVLVIRPGVRTITASVPGSSASASIALTVQAGPMAFLLVSPSAQSVDLGGSVQLSVEGFDSFGNDLGDMSSQATVTSDHPTDVIDGTTVHFLHASTHVLTATLGPASGTVKITVLPALASTGAESSPWILAGGGLLVIGVMLAAIGLRRRTGRAE